MNLWVARQPHLHQAVIDASGSQSPCLQIWQTRVEIVPIHYTSCNDFHLESEVKQLKEDLEKGGNGLSEKAKKEAESMGLPKSLAKATLKDDRQEITCLCFHLFYKEVKNFRANCIAPALWKPTGKKLILFYKAQTVKEDIYLT